MDRFRIQAKAIINGNYIDQWTKSDHYQARILVELCWEELKECRDADNNLTLFTKLSNFLIYLSLRFPVELGELGRWDIGKCKDLYTPVGSRLLLLALIYGNDKFKVGGAWPSPSYIKYRTLPNLKLCGGRMDLYGGGGHERNIECSERGSSFLDGSYEYASDAHTLVTAVDYFSCVNGQAYHYAAMVPGLLHYVTDKMEG